MKPARTRFVSEILSALCGADGQRLAPGLTVQNDQELPGWFDVSDLAAASMGCAGLMLATLGGAARKPRVDKRLASLWFGTSLRPIGWKLPPMWDAIAGDYRTSDGWIRLHTNAPHHRRAALSVLGACESRAALEPIVANWRAEQLESAVIGAGGCAAQMHDMAAWARHDQGRAVALEPLIHWQQAGTTSRAGAQFPPERPLSGIRVLDLTRVIAGPVASRFLAAYGAQVLRIDPPHWNEPGVVPEMTLGKRCAVLDLKTGAGRAVFEKLLSEADVLLHGYRPDALAGLGYDHARLQKINPAMIDVALSAYGWTGPWAGRRGFDSLVQMSCGIAEFGMTLSVASHPVPLPVQALDHATGYLLAGAVLRALDQRARRGVVMSARLSLACTAHLLSKSARQISHPELPAETGADLSDGIENTTWGPAQRIRFPVEIPGVEAHWPHPATALKSSPPVW